MTTRFDPFQEMERWLNSGTRASTPTQGPLAMDLFREGDTFVAKIDMPGVDPSSIDIDVDDRTLTLRAQRRPTADADVKWLSRERESGTFARQLALGRGLATDRISADYTDGVLTLTIPVAEDAKPRKIAINHASSPAQIEDHES